MVGSVLVGVIREVFDIYDNSRNGTLHNCLNNTPEMSMRDVELEHHAV